MSLRKYVTMKWLRLFVTHARDHGLCIRICGLCLCLVPCTPIIHVDVAVMATNRIPRGDHRHHEHQ